MQLHIVNRDHGSYLRGDVLAVLLDVVPFGPLEVVSLWLSGDPIGLPDEYRSGQDFPPGTFEQRTSLNFPNPWSAVVRYPSFRCDLNLAEPWLEDDPRDPGESTRMASPRLWFLDLDALPPGQRSSLEQPGGEATLGANRLRAITNRADATDITDVVGWDDDETLGNVKHRYPGSNARNWV